jgi:hypothetical protein
LIAENDPVSARILEAALLKFGYQPVYVVFASGIAYLPPRPAHASGYSRQA